MSFKNSSLHGNAPDKATAALLLIDVINDLEFPEGDQMLPFALAMAKNLVELKLRAKAANIPAIYVNDNFGRWQSNFNNQVEHCLADDVRGQSLVELLRPEHDDYFVLKPKHSGFYSTSLDILLDYLQVRTVIITGIAGNICVLFTANDAYLRDLRIFVPADCVASNTKEDNDIALAQMAKILKADIRPAAAIDLRAVNQRDS
jgi:nicotinamidase-related amidase